MSKFAVELDKMYESKHYPGRSARVVAITVDKKIFYRFDGNLIKQTHTEFCDFFLNPDTSVIHPVVRDAVPSSEWSLINVTIPLFIKVKLGELECKF